MEYFTTEKNLVGHGKVKAATIISDYALTPHAITASDPIEFTTAKGYEAPLQ